MADDRSVAAYVYDGGVRHGGDGVGGPGDDVGLDLGGPNRDIHPCCDAYTVISDTRNWRPTSDLTVISDARNRVPTAQWRRFASEMPGCGAEQRLRRKAPSGRRPSSRSGMPRRETGQTQERRLAGGNESAAVPHRWDGRRTLAPGVRCQRLPRVAGGCGVDERDHLPTPPKRSCRDRSRPVVRLRQRSSKCRGHFAARRRRVGRRVVLEGSEAGLGSFRIPPPRVENVPEGRGKQ